MYARAKCVRNAFISIMSRFHIHQHMRSIRCAAGSQLWVMLMYVIFSMLWWNTVLIHLYPQSEIQKTEKWSLKKTTKQQQRKQYFKFDHDDYIYSWSSIVLFSHCHCFSKSETIWLYLSLAQPHWMTKPLKALDKQTDLSPHHKTALMTLFRPWLMF